MIDAKYFFFKWRKPHFRFRMSQSTRLVVCIGVHPAGRSQRFPFYKAKQRIFMRFSNNSACSRPTASVGNGSMATSPKGRVTPGLLPGMPGVRTALRRSPPAHLMKSSKLSLFAVRAHNEAAVLPSTAHRKAIFSSLVRRTGSTAKRPTEPLLLLSHLFTLCGLSH